MPRTHGFPLLGWLLARARASRGGVRTGLEGQSELRVVTGSLMAAQRQVTDSQDSFTTVIAPRCGTEQSEADEMLKDASPYTTPVYHRTLDGSERQDHLIVGKGGPL